MSATNYTPISLYYSATASATPSASNLVAGELALNTNDGKLFYKDSSNVVQVLATKGGVNATSSGQVLFNNSGVVGGSNNLFWDSANTRLGVGTSSPTNRLTVQGSGDISKFTNGTVSLYGYSDSAGLGWFTGAGATGVGVYYNNTSNYQAFYTNGSEKARIDSSGNVGIGTSSPTAKLSVVGSPATINYVSSITSSGAGGGTAAAAYGQYISVGQANSNTTFYALYAETNYIYNAPSYAGYFKNIGNASYASYGIYAETTQTDTNGPGIAYGGYLNVASGGTGTNGKTYGLYVNNASASGVQAFGLYVNSTTGATTTIPFSVAVGGTEQMRLDSSGNLNLGQSASALQSGGTGVTVYGNSYSEIKFLNSSTGTTATDGTALVTSSLDFLINNREAGAITFGTTNAERMRIDSSGNVGIGTTSPNGKLEVYTGASGTTPFSNGSNFVLQNSGAVGMSLLSPDANASRIYFGTASNNRNAFIYSDYNSGLQTLIFGIGNSTTAATEVMRLDSSGNLGIGVTSPVAKLHVKTTSNAEYPSGYTSGSNFLLSTGDGGANNVYARIIGGIYTQVNSANLDLLAAGNDYGYGIGWRFTSLATASGAAASRDLVFNQISTSATPTLVATEIMRLTQAGNLGLGVTPSAWSGQTALQIASSGAIASSNSSLDIYANVYYNAGAKYIQSSFASKYTQTSGTHAWFTAPSSTAGSTVTFTQAMTLDNSGNLGIGTTSPSSALTLGAGGIARFNRADNATYNEIKYVTSGDQFYFNQANGGAYTFNITASEKIRIDSSGNLLIGTTALASSNTNSIMFQVAAGAGYFQHISGTASGGTYCQFNYNGTLIGSITQSGTTAVLYNVTSDQRLKENIVDAPSGNIDDIKVRSFDWIADGSHQTYGMVAQELVEVAPYAVNQPQDTEEMMAVDYSKLVPMMIKEIQDLRERLAKAGL